MNLPWEAIVAVSIYIIGSTIGFVWWMATITVTLKLVVDDIKEIKNSGFAKKGDVDKELGKIQKDIDKAHSRIDEIQLKNT